MSGRQPWKLKRLERERFTIMSSCAVITTLSRHLWGGGFEENRNSQSREIGAKRQKGNPGEFFHLKTRAGTLSLYLVRQS